MGRKLVDNKLASKRTIADILKVSLSNIIKLLSGVLVGFLLPKIIGVTDYGYYRTFTLYASYVGIFHFGLADGIYLKYGGQRYENLDKSKFRLYTLIFIILEFIFSLITGLIVIFGVDGEMKFIFICLAAFIFVNNTTGYYQTLSQALGRFNELSIRNIIQSAIITMTIITLWFIHKYANVAVNYRIYTIIYVCILGILFFWYMITYRDITFGKTASFSEEKNNIKQLFIIGFPLLISNLASGLILSLDRQFVNVFYDTDTYAVYAFAYNMLNLVTTAMAAISTVIYPTMKRSSKETLKNTYTDLMKTILVFVSFCLVVYFPLTWFVNWFLPKYSDSLPIFRVILPGLAISSSITIIMHNYYKTDGKEKQFFIKSIIVLCLSGIANYVAYFLFKTTLSISIASILVMIVWHLLIEEYFIRNYKIKWVKTFMFMLLVLILFYSITCIQIWWLAMLLYLVFLIFLILLFYHSDIHKIKTNLFKNLMHKGADDGERIN